MLNFYEFQQTNSKCSYSLNDKVCPLVVIEAEKESYAIIVAEEFK